MSKAAYLKKLKVLIESTNKSEGISKMFLYYDFLYSYVRNGTSLRDYFSYELYLKNRSGKRQFLSMKDMLSFYAKYNDKAQELLLNDKEECLILFSDLVGRDWCGQKHHNSEVDYENFRRKHSKCIVKPLSGCGGHGVRIIETDKPEMGGGKFRKFCKDSNCIVEELIEQHEIISVIYPQAINTIRLFTFRGKVLGAVLRMGRGGSQIDNASSGGIYAEIDVESGRIITPAYSYRREMYLQHPDTGVFLQGTELPLWEQCKQLVEDGWLRISGLPLVGWDIAVTPNGPTIVEVNAQPEIPLLQIPRNKGLRKTIIG